MIGMFVVYCKTLGNFVWLLIGIKLPCLLKAWNFVGIGFHGEYGNDSQGS